MGLNIFKKLRKEDTVIDLATLHKRGIIKEKKETLDLTGASSVVSDASPLGFVGSLANSAENTNNSRLTSSVAEETDEKTKIKGILRDMKLKTDNTYNKIYKLSDRIDLIEKKIERLERRSGLNE